MNYASHALRDAVANTLVMLIVEGGPLGELEEREIADPVTGHAKTIRIIPEAWMRRLEVAARVGAFDRMTPEQVAHRILTTSPAGGPANLEA